MYIDLPTTHHLTPYNNDYPTCERTYVELRVYPGDATSPEEITKALGLQPTSQRSIGQVRTNSLGKSRVSKLNAWFLSSETKVQSKDLRLHLDWLLDIVWPIKDNLNNVQELNDDVRMSVHCIWWSTGGGGPTIWPRQMYMLSSLNLELAIAMSDYNDEA